MASTYLTRQITGAGTNQTKGTISLWVKVGNIGSDQRFFSYENTSVANNITVFKFYGLAGGSMGIQFADQTGGSNNARFDGTRALRDCFGWYNFVAKWDTTQSTNTDRLKIFINGELQTSTHGSYTYPSEDATLNVGHNSNAYIDIGRWRGSNSQYFDGYMSHFHYCDGYAYDASSFGSTDATTGEWKINTSPSVSYGTNGVFLKMEDSSNMDLDSSSNAHTMTTSGTFTPTIDNPSHLFASLNATWTDAGMTFSNGNNTVQWTGDNKTCRTTIGMEKGKYYCEFKVINNVGAGIQAAIVDDTILPSTYAHNGAGGHTYRDTTGNKYKNGVSASYGNSYTTNDIVGIAYDADNGTLWFSKNGTWQNSATIAEIGAGTTTNAAYTGITGIKFFGASGYAGDDKIAWNFGQGYFGTTAISSAGTNASSIGSFEYDCPENFTALTTKGLNE